MQPNLGMTELGIATLKPVGYDRKGPMWRKDDLDKVILQEIQHSNSYQNRRAKNVATSIEEATEIVNETTKLFSAAVSALSAKHSHLEETAKKVSGSVREQADKLASGLSRVEKAADFDKLERYVILLERAATAFSTLADLEKTGKLEKIAASIR